MRPGWGDEPPAGPRAFGDMRQYRAFCVSQELRAKSQELICSSFRYNSLLPSEHMYG